MKYDNFYKLTTNAAKCLKCGDVVESKSRHDFVTCKCGSLSVDGGLSYCRRLYSDAALVEDMSETRKYTLEELKGLVHVYRDPSGALVVAESGGFSHAVVECAKEWYGKDLSRIE